MSWGKVDDGLHCHPKVMRLPNTDRGRAMGLWVLALSWCSAVEKEDTGGQIPAHMLRQLTGTPRIAALLVDVGLWEIDSNGDGWCFHDWWDYREDPKKQAARKAQKAQNQANYNARKMGHPQRTTTAQATRDDRASNARASRDDHAASQRRPSPADKESADRSVTAPRPDPSRPKGGTGSGKGANGGRQAASASAPDGPPPPAPESEKLLPKEEPSDTQHAVRAADAPGVSIDQWVISVAVATGTAEIAGGDLNLLDSGHTEISVAISSVTGPTDVTRIADLLTPQMDALGHKARRRHGCSKSDDYFCESGRFDDWDDNGSAILVSATVPALQVAEYDAEVRSIVDAVAAGLDVIVSEPDDVFAGAR